MYFGKLFSMKISLDALVGLGFVLSLLILAVIGFLSYHSLSEFIDTAQSVENSHTLIEKLDDLTTEVGDVESASRGFVMSGDDLYLEPYYSALNEVNSTLQQIRELSSGTAQEVMVRQIEALCSEKLDHSRQLVQLRRQDGIKAASRLFLTGTGHEMMDRLRAKIDEMGSIAKGALKRRSAAAQVRGRNAIRALFIGMLLSFSILSSIYYQLHREIVRRRSSEREIQSLNSDLERRIEERTVRLAELNKELAQRNEELARANHLKSEFLARMSHELRTPMNAIIGFSDLLAEEPEGPLNEEYRRYIKHINEGARHLLQLINDILDLSKIEAGRLELFPTGFRAAEALEEVMSVIRPLAQIKHIVIENRVAANVQINADRTRFKQVLYNLLSNAVKFTPEKGRVWIEALNSGERVFFTVADTGNGIAPEEHENIFNEFHQVAKTTRGVKEGTGLGLAITRRLIEMHGGSISVESKPGNGSRFIFSLNSAFIPAEIESQSS